MSGILVRDPGYTIAFLYSAGAHILLALSLFGLNAFSHRYEDPVVYSVTLESGKSLGGVSQVPKDDKKKEAAPLKKVAEPEPVQKQQVEEKADVIISEKKKEEEKKKKKEEEAKKAKAKELEKKKEKEKAKATPKPTPVDVNKQYQQAMQRYLGESAQAGGKGFGAASVGGVGMGGGKVVPAAVLSYQKTISALIKNAWRWHDTSTTLVARVYFELSASGEVNKVEVVEGSGNNLFDDSVLRAVYKVSPLPPPPGEFYNDYFRYVKLRFDPRE